MNIPYTPVSTNRSSSVSSINRSQSEMKSLRAHQEYKLESWSHLPIAEKKKIASYLDGIDLAHISQLDLDCKAFAEDQELWQTAYQNEVLASRFPKQDQARDFSKLYANTYLERQKAILADRQEELIARAHTVLSPLHAISRIGQGAGYLIGAAVGGAISATGLVATTALTATAGVSTIPLAIVDPYLQSSLIMATFSSTVTVSMNAATGATALICSIPQGIYERAQGGLDSLAARSVQDGYFGNTRQESAHEGAHLKEFLSREPHHLAV